MRNHKKCETCKYNNQCAYQNEDNIEICEDVICYEYYESEGYIKTEYSDSTKYIGDK